MYHALFTAIGEARCEFGKTLAGFRSKDAVTQLPHQRLAATKSRANKSQDAELFRCYAKVSVAMANLMIAASEAELSSTGQNSTTLVIPATTTPTMTFLKTPSVTSKTTKAVMQAPARLALPPPEPPTVPVIWQALQYANAWWLCDWVMLVFIFVAHSRHWRFLSVRARVL